jgi:hypothetical protein
MSRTLLVQSLDGDTVATVSEANPGKYEVVSDDGQAIIAIKKLLSRGRKTGLLYHHDHRQKTTKGTVFRMYGRWSKPGDPDFLDALADALIEFNLFAYTEELLDAEELINA